MINLFKSKENKRIEFLFDRYNGLINNGMPKEEALVTLWGEITTRSGQLKNRYGFIERNLNSKKKLIEQTFDHVEIGQYDLYKTIAFIISWEFPGKYNRMSTIDEIRSGKDAQSVLLEKIKKMCNIK